MIMSNYWLLMNHFHLMQLVSKRENMSIMNISNRLLDQSCIRKSFIIDVVSMDLMSKWADWSMNIIAQTGD